MNVASIDAASMVIGKCMQESSELISKELADIASTIIFLAEK